MSNKVASVGSKFPEFNKKACVALDVDAPGKEFADISNKDIDGKWAVIFWWPKDFTFVCPTEIAAFNDAYGDFTDRDTVLLGASTDSEFVHLAWRRHDEKLKSIQFPMLADTSKSLAEELGILNEDEKIAYRATYIVDPQGIIRWVNVNDLSVGRNVEEVLRVLDALQTDELCPCNWKKGEQTLSTPEPVLN